MLRHPYGMAEHSLIPRMSNAFPRKPRIEMLLRSATGPYGSRTTLSHRFVRAVCRLAARSRFALRSASVSISPSETLPHLKTSMTPNPATDPSTTATRRSSNSSAAAEPTSPSSSTSRFPRRPGPTGPSTTCGTIRGDRCRDRPAHGTRTPRHIPCGRSISAGRRRRVAMAAPRMSAMNTARANQRRKMCVLMNVLPIAALAGRCPDPAVRT